MDDTEHAVMALAGLPQRVRRERAFAELGMLEARYAQVLGHLLRRPDVEAEYPVLVHRLQRLRAARRTTRH